MKVPQALFGDSLYRSLQKEELVDKDVYSVILSFD